MHVHVHGVSVCECGAPCRPLMLGFPPCRRASSATATCCSAMRRQPSRRSATSLWSEVGGAVGRGPWAGGCGGPSLPPRLPRTHTPLGLAPPRRPLPPMPACACHRAMPLTPLGLPFAHACAASGGRSHSACVLKDGGAFAWGLNTHVRGWGGGGSGWWERGHRACRVQAQAVRCAHGGGGAHAWRALARQRPGWQGSGVGSGQAPLRRKQCALSGVGFGRGAGEQLLRVLLPAASRGSRPRPLSSAAAGGVVVMAYGKAWLLASSARSASCEACSATSASITCHV